MSEESATELAWLAARVVPPIELDKALPDAAREPSGRNEPLWLPRVPLTEGALLSVVVGWLVELVNVPDSPNELREFGTICFCIGSSAKTESSPILAIATCR